MSKITDHKKKYILVGLLALLFALVLACGIYISSYYHSDSSVTPFLASSDTVIVEEQNDFISFIGKQSSDTAIIFYPGAKVETNAYAPLLHQLAEQGVDCFLMKMPFHLAVLSPNKADNVLNNTNYSYENWYLAGHSLGGAMVSSYGAKHSAQLKGLILLGAYSTSDLSDTNLSVLSIYGSNDQVLNMENYQKNRKNLPSSTIECIIDGGNHAYYGNYGEQKGDGAAAITREEQQEQTCSQIMDFIK